jgi:hypothetical protein
MYTPQSTIHLHIRKLKIALIPVVRVASNTAAAGIKPALACVRKKGFFILLLAVIQKKQHTMTLDLYSTYLANIQPTVQSEG